MNRKKIARSVSMKKKLNINKKSVLIDIVFTISSVPDSHLHNKSNFCHGSIYWQEGVLCPEKIFKLISELSKALIKGMYCRVLSQEKTGQTFV